MKESGDIILSGSKIYAELGEALARKVPSRASETTIFKSLGMAVKDRRRIVGLLISNKRKIIRNPSKIASICGDLLVNSFRLKFGKELCEALAGRTPSTG
jgi:hypothetical protein